MQPFFDQCGAGFVLLCAFAGLAPAQVTVDTSVSFKLVNKGSGLPLAIQPASQWHFLPGGNNRYKIVNVTSGQILGGGAVLQCPDNGAADRLWEVIDADDGYSRIRNVKTGLLLGGQPALVPGDESAATLWRLVPVGPSYPDPLPVAGDTLVHDPSMVKTVGGTYYLFGTHGGIRMQSSQDRTHFVRAGEHSP